MEERAEPVAVAASELKLAWTEESSLLMEATAEEAPPATELATEESSEASEPVMEERAEPPGTAVERLPATEEATEERMDSIWAEARPAPAIMAMVEKRILIVCWLKLKWIG